MLDALTPYALHACTPSIQHEVLGERHRPLEGPRDGACRLSRVPPHEPPCPAGTRSRHSTQGGCQGGRLRTLPGAGGGHQRPYGLLCWCTRSRGSVPTRTPHGTPSPSTAPCLCHQRKSIATRGRKGGNMDPVETQRRL